MKRLYLFYPHFYIKATSRELLIYDTKKFKNIYLNKVSLSSQTVDILNKFGYLEECDDNVCILQQFDNEYYGYYVHPQSLMPYIPERKLRITTSLLKEKKALGYNLTSYTNMMLSSITFLLNNTISTYLNALSYQQLEYPNVNCSEINIEALCLQLYSFSLETITLSGEISYHKLEKILAYARKRNIIVIYRVHYLAYPVQYIQNILHKFNSLTLELLVDHNTPLDILNLKEERLILKYIIASNYDLIMLGDIAKDMILCPIFLENGLTTLQPQMILAQDDILKSRQTLKECYLKDYINTSCYGHLTINYDGMVSCLNQQIESLRNQDLIYIVNHWVDSEECLWYFTRKKKIRCKECALQALCPPISIYEQIKAYKCPCIL